MKVLLFIFITSYTALGFADDRPLVIPLEDDQPLVMPLESDGPPEIGVGDSNGYDPNNCTHETSFLFEEIVPVIAGYGNRRFFTQPHIKKIGDNLRKGCVDTSQLPEYFPRYFNTKDGELNDNLKKDLNKFWVNKIDELKELKLSGPQDKFDQLYHELKQQADSAEILRPASFPSKESFEKYKAKSCQPTKGIVERLPPVRNQASSGWCNYFAYADILSFEAGKNISPAYFGHLLSTRGSGGAGAAQFNDILDNHGVCEESVLPSNINPDDFTRELDDLNKAIGLAVKDDVFDPLCQQLLGVKKLLPGVDFKTIMDVSRTVTAEDGSILGPKILNYRFDEDIQYVRNSYVSNLVYVLCEENRLKNKKLTEKRFKSFALTSRKEDNSPADLMKQLDLALDKNEPAAFSYEYTGLVDETWGGDHVSSIVDRRSINGKCQYLVRNSWGPTSCTKVVEEKDACEPAGHFWVNSSKLIKYIKSVSVLK